jgi:hypothetical protein
MKHSNFIKILSKSLDPIVLLSSPKTKFIIQVSKPVLNIPCTYPETRSECTVPVSRPVSSELYSRTWWYLCQDLPHNCRAFCVEPIPSFLHKYTHSPAACLPVLSSILSADRPESWSVWSVCSSAHLEAFIHLTLQCPCSTPAYQGLLKTAISH